MSEEHGLENSLSQTGGGGGMLRPRSWPAARDCGGSLGGPSGSCRPVRSYIFGGAKN